MPGRAEIRTHRVGCGRRGLPNGQPIPNDGAGRGLKHSIDTWLAAQAKVAQAPTQQVFFTRKAPPHSPPSIDSCPSSARSEEVTEAHTVRVISTGQAEEVSVSDKEDPFFQVFAAEKKKHEIRQSRLPKFHPSAPSTSR